MEEFCRLTNIPLEAPRQEGPVNTTRPPWIRPVRKKAPSIARSAQSGDSPSHHSSPEGFSPIDFFAEPMKPFAPAVRPPSTAGTPSTHSSPQTPYVNNAPTQQHHSNNSQGFMDTSGGMAMDQLIRGEDGMYGMTPGMMALFQDGGVDALFTPDFMQQQQHGPMQPPPPPQSHQHHQPDRMSSSNGTPGNASFVGSPGFL
jgi:hypothetical protein